jgi:hypothetical protein
VRCRSWLALVIAQAHEIQPLKTRIREAYGIPVSLRCQLSKSSKFQSKPRPKPLHLHLLRG